MIPSVPTAWLLVLLTASAAFADQQPQPSYHMEHTKDSEDGILRFWAVDTGNRNIRYPCRLVPPLFTVFMCIDSEGNVIDLDATATTTTETNTLATEVVAPLVLANPPDEDNSTTMTSNEQEDPVPSTKARGMTTRCKVLAAVMLLALALKLYLVYGAWSRGWLCCCSSANDDEEDKQSIAADTASVGSEPEEEPLEQV